LRNGDLISGDPFSSPIYLKTNRTCRYPSQQTGLPDLQNRNSKLLESLFSVPESQTLKRRALSPIVPKRVSGCRDRVRIVQHRDPGRVLWGGLDRSKCSVVLQHSFHSTTPSVATPSPSLLHMVSCNRCCEQYRPPPGVFHYFGTDIKNKSDAEYLTGAPHAVVRCPSGRSS
jgi:hypothetical protein